MKILCVAEKPSIAKAVAAHLGGGQLSVRNTRNKFVKNYDFTFRFTCNGWGDCQVTMTSVIGHLIGYDFADEYKKWRDFPPSALFEARIVEKIDHEDVADNIKQEARHARVLYIWTDCDREGEYIGSEVRTMARRTNPNIEVKRAKFSNIERAHIIRAAHRPGEIDERQAAAVAARTELDLRIGAAFTRWQTLALQGIPGLENQVISYGSCQFPTLGFVVDRFKRVKNFVPELFWSIKVVHERDDISVTFNWDRNRLFDRMAVVILFERCLIARIATVTSVVKKPTRKWKPLPLTTVELQKLGSRFLHLPSQQVMTIAESLYTKGFISYPRTETDQFDRSIDLRTLVQKQYESNDWGDYARGLLENNRFSQPRNGRHNDQAHPPIHPVAFAVPEDYNDRRVYEFITRRFLACCSEDALGESTTVSLSYGDEDFHANGLVVIARNYLEVYPYDRWESSQTLPQFQQGETFVPTEANMTDGRTSAPGFLTEPELITLMDVNGIGTDATIAEHIAKIKERMYVFATPRGRGGGGNDGDEDDGDAGAGRGRGRGRGRGARGRGGRGRGGAGGNAPRGGMDEFIPSNLGIALVESYDQIGFDTSLSKPFLRKEMEQRMRQICEGTMVKGDVVHQSVEQYREMFGRANRNVNTMVTTTRNYMQG